MTREEAVKIIKNEKECVNRANCDRDCANCDLVMDDAVINEAYDMAIKALEQPEPCEYYAICRHGRDEEKLRARLKFCEYCNEDFDGYVKPIEKNCHAFIRFGMNGWELDLKANGWHGSAKIRYCPMCGRKLKK